jgi:hypothetical protein
MSATLRVLNGNIAMSSFGQSQTGSTTVQTPVMMVGEKNKTVTDQGPYSANQSGAATTDVVSVGADYGIWDITANQAIDVNSTNFKDSV